MATGVEVSGYTVDRQEEVLTDDALAFLAELHRHAQATRLQLLERRKERRAEIARTGTLDFLPETKEVRDGDWKVAEAPADLRDRRVEMTGPTDRKMTINALNSGAKVWLADFEDSPAPTWELVISGQVNLIDAQSGDGKLTYDSPEGKHYEVSVDEQPTVVLRPRGWHLDEKHITVDGEHIAGGLVDFGLYFFHNARKLVDRGSGPVLLPPEDRVAPRGTPLERRLRLGPGPGRHPAGHRARHGPHRDDHGGLRDGGDPLRAARARFGPQRRPLGLPVLGHQELPRAGPGLRAARPQLRGA